MTKRNSKQLKRKMEHHWLAAFHSLAPVLQTAIHKLGKNVPCPVEGGKDGFRLFLNANETGGGVKQSWRVIPEGIDMLMWINNWSFIETYDALEQFLGTGVSNNVRYLPAKKVQSNDDKLRIWLNRVWKESYSLQSPTATVGRTYCRYRQILESAQVAKDVRYHPSLNYRVGPNIYGQFGALVAIVRNNSGKAIALHRTYLNELGHKVELGDDLSAKKLTPSIQYEGKGRAVQLFEPASGMLGIAEGIETALSVYQATGVPVWAGLSHTMLHSFTPPAGVHTLVNFVDKDKNGCGLNTANQLQSRLEQQGIRVINMVPPLALSPTVKGVDWADQWIQDPNGFAQVKDLLLTREKAS